MFEEKNNENASFLGAENNADKSGNITLEKNEETARSFTQHEVDEIVKTRLARALKNMPSKDELLEFENLKKINEENEAAILKLRAESENNMQRLLTYERKEILNKRGIEDKFKDFAMFEAEKLTNEDVSFDNAIDMVIENNEWLLKKTGFKTGMSQGSFESGISSLEESFYRRNPKLR